MSSLKQTLNETLAKEGIQINGAVKPEYENILSLDALKFVATLERNFGSIRKELLRLRADRLEKLRNGEIQLDFRPETASIRSGDWKCGPLPSDLIDRRVEITGPVDRKMIINALNSGARVFMADFEDSSTPTWTNMVDGQANLFDAVRRTISFSAPGKEYKLNENVATLMVRPRGWHLEERGLSVDGHAISGSLFDFGLYFFHNARELISRGSGPYYYLPKMESHLETRLWNDIFVHAQKALDIPNGTIKATCLIETLPAAFEMDEFLYELRDHSAGLNCGRWDYIFSAIKVFRHDPHAVMPDRSKVLMTEHFLNSYVTLNIATCHKRGVHCMGGMAAQIPIRVDPEANNAAILKVRQDKLREVKAGHDGTWVAHPALIPIALEVFNEHMPMANQLHVIPDVTRITAKDLISFSKGTISEAGVRGNLAVAIKYIESWLRGQGCVAINHLMEDAATAEIARTQLWQWIQHHATLEDGRQITKELVDQLLREEMGKIQKEVGDSAFTSGKYTLADQVLRELVLSDRFTEFLTIAAYDHLEQ